MATVYDLKLVVCTIGGVGLNGYGSDDAVQVEWDSPLTEQKKTADGDVIYSRTNDRSCTVTITLSQHSRAYSLLMPLMAAQQLGPIITPLPFYLFDPSNRESMSGEVVFTDRPAPSKGKAAGDVQFKTHVPKMSHSPPIV